MNDKSTDTVHWSFWLVAAFALLWNVMGSANYMMQVTSDSLAAFPETHRAIIESRPGWATGAFAIGVFVGALGGLLLLLRKSAAYYLFIVSLLGVAVTTVHTVDVIRSPVEFGVFEVIVMALMPVLVAAYFIWYAKRAANKGWVS